MTRRRRAAAAAFLAVACLGALPARANDRPYANTWTAESEEDDDHSWSVETWWQKLGRQRGLVLAPEYAFSPYTTLQFEATRGRDAGARDDEFELEFKHLFNSLARDGWGAGVVLVAGWQREEGGWRREGWALRLPRTLALGDSGGRLHLNVGVERPRDGAARAYRALGGAWPLAPWAPRTQLFAEATRSGPSSLQQLGLRHWVKRERFAVDRGLLRARDDGERRRGWSIGLSWFDL